MSIEQIEKEFEKDMGITHRFELKNGKYGAYFYDNESGAMSLENIVGRLNEIDPLKVRLWNANKRKRGDKW